MLRCGSGGVALQRRAAEAQQTSAGQSAHSGRTFKYSHCTCRAEPDESGEVDPVVAARYVDEEQARLNEAVEMVADMELSAEQLKVGDAGVWMWVV